MSDNYRANLIRVVQESSSETGMPFVDLVTDIMLDGKNGNPTDFELVEMIKNYGN